MKSTTDVRKNYVYNTAYQILLIIFPLVTTPYLSRVLGPEGIGEYSYYYSIAYYFGIFVLLGLNNYGNRTIAMKRDSREELSRMFKSIYAMQLIVGSIISFLYLLCCVFIFKSQLSYVFFVYIVSAVIDINWFFFGMEMFKLTVIRNTIVKILSVISIFIFVRTAQDIWIYSLILCCGFLVSNFLLWPFLIKIINLKTMICRKDITNHIRPNLVLFLPVIAVSLYKVLDKIMLGSMTGMVEVGYYESVEKIMNIPLALITSLGTIMLPRMSNMMSQNSFGEQAMKTIKGSMFFAVFISSAMSFGLIAIAPELVPWFFGNDFKKCIGLIYILMPSCIFLAFANVIRTQYLVPAEKDRIFVISVFMGAITNVVINSIFIPKYASYGAAFGTLIAEIVVCVYQTFQVRKVLPIKEILSKVVPFILFGVIMMVIVFNIPFVTNYFISIMLKVFVGMLIYILCSFIYVKKANIYQR